MFGGLKTNVNVPKFGRAKNGEPQTAKGGRTEARQPQKGKKRLVPEQDIRNEGGNPVRVVHRGGQSEYPKTRTEASISQSRLNSLQFDIRSYP